MARSPVSPATTAFRNKRLSVIAEDGSTVPYRNHRGKPLSPAQSPPYTPTASHRPESRQWADQPPHHSDDQSPPGYEHWNEDSPSSTRQRLVEKVRSNKQITRRGGWKRLLIILIVLIVLIVALAIGLGVGLSQRLNPPSDGSASDEPPPPSLVGNWTFPVYSTIATPDCTPDPDTWRCHPYTIYQPNLSNSLTQFTWIITEGDSNNPPKSFNISTTSNPFNLNFANVPLNLMNNGTDDEYYGFELSFVNPIIPSTNITADNQQTTCYYNNTILRAELYTKRPSQNVPNTQQSTNSGSNLGGATSANGINWKTWTTAVNITQTAAGGPNVPNCYFLQTGEVVSSPKLLPAKSPSLTCECGYQNFDLPS